MATRGITVVGSLNMDVRLGVARLPRSGETIAADGLTRSIGGKGGNQAVAAARLGRPVTMVGAVGDDEAGREITARLDAEGVATDGVDTVEGPSGTAVVLWERPESTIVIAAGANAAVDAARVSAHAGLVRAAGAVLCQLETPESALEAVLATARGLTVLNPAPAGERLPGCARHFGLLVPNRHELATLAGASRPPATVDDVEALARTLSLEGDLVVTLGADGSAVVPGGTGRATHVPARTVTAVDTTAAGDSYCAALAGALLDGATLVDAAHWASAVAAVTTTRHGAMDSLPVRADIPASPSTAQCEKAATR